MKLVDDGRPVASVLTAESGYAITLELQPLFLSLSGSSYTYRTYKAIFYGCGR
jgi:hypothetical protein